MKAWLLDRIGSLSDMRLADVPEPVAGEGEVVLQLRCAGLNPADRYLAEGQYPARPAMPHVLGRDGVGTVMTVGPRVNGVGVGDRFSVLRGEAGVTRWGTLAECVAVPVEALVEVPGDWTDAQAGGAALVYLTAYQALTQWGEIGQAVVLVSGASGGVGVACVQLGVAMGHTVIGLSRSGGKGERLKQLGAAAVFDPNDAQWRGKAKQFLGQRRVDLAIDNVGGALLPEMIDTLGFGGKVSVVGRLAGPVPQFNTASLFFRRIRMGGVALGTYTNAESRSAWAEVLALLGKERMRPVVDSVFAFEQVPAAFARLAEGPMGKVVVSC